MFSKRIGLDGASEFVFPCAMSGFLDMHPVKRYSGMLDLYFKHGEDFLFSPYLSEISLILDDLEGLKISAELKRSLKCLLQGYYDERCPFSKTTKAIQTVVQKVSIACFHENSKFSFFFDLVGSPPIETAFVRGSEIVFFNFASRSGFSEKELSFFTPCSGGEVSFDPKAFDFIPEADFSPGIYFGHDFAHKQIYWNRVIEFYCLPQSSFGAGDDILADLENQYDVFSSIWDFVQDVSDPRQRDALEYVIFSLGHEDGLRPLIWSPEMIGRYFFREQSGLDVLKTERGIAMFRRLEDNPFCCVISFCVDRLARYPFAERFKVLGDDEIVVAVDLLRGKFLELWGEAFY